MSEASALALHAVCLLAGAKMAPATAGQLATRLGASEAHLAKVLQRLGKAGVVRAARGPHGGYALARDAAGLSLFEVCSAVDGPPTANACLLGVPVCQGRCMFGGHLAEVARGLLAYLRETSVADVVECGLNETAGAVAPYLAGPVECEEEPV
jgi:Rrf2 family transcriptional regulator, nitric oxide-sensitive transcriptional repressor